MPWTATATAPVMAGADVSVTVTYTNGTNRGARTFTETINASSPALIKQTVINRLAQLHAATDALTTLQAGPVDTTVTPPPDPPQPTQAELDRAAWLKNYYLWIKVKTTLIDTGILTGSETAIAALKTSVQTGFKAAYINYI